MAGRRRPHGCGVCSLRPSPCRPASRPWSHRRRWSARLQCRDRHAQGCPRHGGRNVHQLIGRTTGAQHCQDRGRRLYFRHAVTADVTELTSKALQNGNTLSSNGSRASSHQMAAFKAEKRGATETRHRRRSFHDCHRKARFIVHFSVQKKTPTIEGRGLKVVYLPLWDSEIKKSAVRADKCIAQLT